jgi:demethylmenaquinone methyltransferase/2-methoxy-6-polyprenyl-1,4-benzoquinol methylase
MSHDGSGAMFDAIAGRYDTLNRVLSLGIDQGWRRRTARALGSPRQVLDLATGTADLALAVARLHPEASVVGVDPSTNMLALGRRKIEREGLGARVALQHGGAEVLPFPPDRFDATCIAFGIRNVPDRHAALREMVRVTRPGGTVAILELSEPRVGLLAVLARWHVHHVVPLIGGLVSGRRAYRYLQTSIAAFPPSQVFATHMREAGLTDVRVEPLTFGACCLFVGKVP